MDLIHVLLGDRQWFKILCGSLSITVHDLKVKVTDLEFLCGSFVYESFCETCDGFDSRLPW